jgi:hypothetical protein
MRLSIRTEPNPEVARYGAGHDIDYSEASTNSKNPMPRMMIRHDRKTLYRHVALGGIGLDYQ